MNLSSKERLLNNKTMRSPSGFKTCREKDRIGLTEHVLTRKEDSIDISAYKDNVNLRQYLYSECAPKGS